MENKESKSQQTAGYSLSPKLKNPTNLSNKELDKNSEECQKLIEESIRLWKSKDFLASARIWEDNGYLSTAAEMYEEVGKVYDKSRFATLENQRTGVLAWFSAERIHESLGRDEEAERVKSQAKKAARNLQLSENYRMPIHPNPRNIFERMQSLESQGENYTPQRFLDEIANIGYEFGVYTKPDINEEGFVMDGCIIGPALTNLVDRVQTVEANIEFSKSKVLARIWASCELSLEAIDRVLPILFGQPTKKYSRRETMSNYAEWIK